MVLKATTESQVHCRFTDAVQIHSALLLPWNADVYREHNLGSPAFWFPVWFTQAGGGGRVGAPVLSTHPIAFPLWRGSGSASVQPTPLALPVALLLWLWSHHSLPTASGLHRGGAFSHMIHCLDIPLWVPSAQPTPGHLAPSLQTSP